MSTLTEAFPKSFIDRLLVYLVPHFIGLADDLADAKRQALDTLGAYGARTRAELIQATRIIALQCTTMDMLTEAKVCDHLPESFKLRLRACAIAMTKTALLDQKDLTERLKRDPPAPVRLVARPEAKPVAETAAPAPAHPTPDDKAAQAPAAPKSHGESARTPAQAAPATVAPSNEPDDMTDEMAQKALDFANAQIQAYRGRAGLSRPAGPPPGQDPPNRGPIMRQMAEEMRQIMAAARPAAGPA